MSAKKLLVIESCSGCPHEYIGSCHHATVGRRNLGAFFIKQPIPDWCPLPDGEGPFECEDVFVVSQTCDGGKWNKLVKSQERWWYTQKEAQEWLDKQPDWFRVSNKVFSARLSLSNIQRAT